MWLIFFMKIRQIKHFIFVALLGLLMANLYVTYDIWSLRSNLDDLNFPKSQSLISNEPIVSSPTITPELTNDFDYELIGYRASSGSRSSVILKKDNKEFVVQEGELLENRFTLTSVEKDKVTFNNISGQVFEIQNKVGLK